MTRDEFERFARALSEQASASFTTSSHAAKFLAENGVIPEGMDRRESFKETCEVFGAEEWPMHTRDQRQTFAFDHGWSDSEEIAYVAVAWAQAKLGDQAKREIVVLQKTDGDVEVYLTTEEGRGWTLDPVNVRASF